MLTVQLVPEVELQPLQELKLALPEVAGAVSCTLLPEARLYAV
jgi:hypothetical protein